MRRNGAKMTNAFQDVTISNHGTTINVTTLLIRSSSIDERVNVFQLTNVAVRFRKKSWRKSNQWIRKRNKRMDYYM